MPPIAAGLLAALSAVVTAYVLCGAARWVGPVDQPRKRGSHRRPTPTAGGLGVIGGASTGVLVFTLLAQSGPRAPFGPGGADEPLALAGALAASAGLGLLGALDDLYALGARPKLLIQVLVALGFSLWVARVEALPLGGGVVLSLGPVLGVVGTALWLVVVSNAVNFMDGANGLASGSVAIALCALALAAVLGGDPPLAAAALSGAMGLAGFLPWNLPTGRLFQGDAGALFSGFYLAALAVIGAGPRGEGPVDVYFAPLAMIPFLADVLLTLLSRARSRKPMLDAHAEHVYQRWLARTGSSHLALAWRAHLLVGLYSAAALFLLRAPPWAAAAGLAAGAALAVAGWVRLRRSLQG